MSEQLTQDILYTTGKFLDTGFEYPLEREILLADYDRPVFKIVKTNTEYAITQKYINTGKLIIEGFFKISIYYQPPAGANLTVISKKIPFQKQFDLASAVQPPYFVYIDGETQYINTRAVNPTRIDVRGVYQFTVRGYFRQQNDVSTAVNSTTVCTDSEELQHFYLCAQGVRQFSAEEELSVSGEPDKILNTDLKNTNMSVTVYRDKVNVKGEIVADILYTLNDSPDLHHHLKRFQYNQIVEMPGVAENNVAYAQFSPISFTITQNPDTRKINCIVSAQLDVKAFRKSRVITVTDAFSRVYNYDKNRRNIAFDTNIHAINRNMQITLEDSAGSGYEPVHCFINTGTPVMSAADGKSVLKSRLTASILVKNKQNEYECFAKTEDIIIDVGTEILPQNEYLLDISVSDTAVSVTEETMRVAVTLSVSGFAINREVTTVMDRFDENTDAPLEKPADALVLYYGQKGEKIFDIALRYKTDTEDIIKENNLENKYLSDDRMLFIPVFEL